MTGDMDTVSRKRKLTDTVTKESPKKKAASKPLSISLKDVSPEFKRLVVDELVKSGKATVIKKKLQKVSKK